MKDGTTQYKFTLITYCTDNYALRIMNYQLYLVNLQKIKTI